MPLLEQAFDDYMAVNPKRTARTNKHYRTIFGYLADWRMRPLDAIGRRDVEDRFNSLTRNNGWAPANMSISLLGSIYRRPCVDLEGLRNPVELWRAGGGKYHPPKRRRISAPAEVLPRWKKGIEAEAIASVEGIQDPPRSVGRPARQASRDREVLVEVVVRRRRRVAQDAAEIAAPEGHDQIAVQGERPAAPTCEGIPEPDRDAGSAACEASRDRGGTVEGAVRPQEREAGDAALRAPARPD